MKTITGVWGVFLLLFVATLGCNEPKPSASDVAEKQSPAGQVRPGNDVEYFTPGPEFKLSPEAAKQQQEAERPTSEEVVAAESTRPTAENPPAKPRRRTVFDSLYEAVRNGAAEALDENAGSP